MAVTISHEAVAELAPASAHRKPLAGNRILLTGMTPLGINSQKRTFYTTDLDALVAGLRHLGAEVDWKLVNIGDDLSMYTHVIVETIEPVSLAARYMVNSMWVLSQRPDAFVHISDCKSTFGINKTQYARLARVGSSAVNGLKSRASLPAYNNTPGVKEAVDKVFAHLASWDWSYRLMYSGMPVGDPSKLKVPKAEMSWYDPTSYIRKATPMNELPGDRQRERNWIAPFLVDRSSYLRRQQFTWPLIVVGGRKHAAAHSSLGRIPEGDLMKLWRDNWGFVNIPYSYAGSNWWRAKYVFAAQLQSISVGSEIEHRLILGDNYVKPELVEQMSDHDLQQLGAAQAKSFWDTAWTFRDYHEYLVNTFRS